MIPNLHTLSLFPELFDCLKHGVTGRAITDKVFTLRHWQLRDYAGNLHGHIDDRPYGGGPGMLIRAEPVIDAVNAIKHESGKMHVICASPQGKKLSNPILKSWQNHNNILFLAGRYEGIDERAVETVVDEEVSIGDYVLSGGELAVAVMIDAYARLLPGVLGNDNSAAEDSFSTGLLDCPHYTRPLKLGQKHVPKVLTEGNHSEIAKWRRKHALGRTYLRRPDLLDIEKLSILDASLINDYLSEFAAKEKPDHDEHH